MHWHLSCFNWITNVAWVTGFMERSMMQIYNNERSFMFPELPVRGEGIHQIWIDICLHIVIEKRSSNTNIQFSDPIVSTFAIVPTLKSSWWISMAWASLFPSSCLPGLLIIYATDPQSFLDQLSSELGIRISWHWCDTIRRYQTLKGIKTLQNGQPGVLIIYATRSHFFWTYTNWNLSFLNSQQGIIKINLQVRYDASVSRLLPHFSMFCKKSYLAITKMVPHD